MMKNLQENLHQVSINNQKVQKDGNLRVKNAPKPSAKYLEDKICKIKQIQNIPVTLRTFLYPPKFFQKNLTLNRTSLKLIIK